MLLLEGPKHKGRKPDEGWTVNGCRIYISEAEPNGLKPNSAERQTTHTRVWDGSDVLVDYLEHAYRPTTPPKHVVELGAGCGLAGIAAAVLFPDADVMLTDVAPCLQNLRANIERNRDVLGLGLHREGDRGPDRDRDRVEAMTLDWTDLPARGQILGTPCDLVLAADVVWLTDLVDPLLEVLRRVAADNPACVTLMAYQSRSKLVDERLFRGLEARSFSCEQVGSSGRVDVFRLTYRRACPS